VSGPEKRASALAANRIALDVGLDREMLASELGELAFLLPEVQLDLSITGFDLAETGLILGDQQTPVASVEDEKPPELRPEVSRLDELWKLGNHRLLCGDDKDAAASRLLPTMFVCRSTCAPAVA